MEILANLTEEDKSDPPFMDQVKNEVNEYMISLKSARLKSKKVKLYGSPISSCQKSKHVKF